MRYIADLHIHSPFSRATSRTSHLQGLAAWAAVKGIQVVGTGDFTHPGWLQQINDSLVEAEPGFFRLRSGLDQVPPGILPPGLQPDLAGIRFVLTAEISSIYKRGGQVRKVHNILFAPDLASVRRINGVLAGIGNLEADGRPILGLDSRNLLEILLESAPQGFLVPAHIWTPWFSLFGSKSGFNAIEECFGDLSDQIFALETGLSSDPDMNRLVSALDRFTLISNSDCHSPAKLGREANILTTGFDFPSLREALRRPAGADGEQRFAATVEFYPEEGKYHCDGHRKCRVSMEPAETRKVGAICPVCHRPLTVGVLNRVMELADRDTPLYPPGSPGVHSLVPLAELLGEILDAGPATKGVTAAYARLISQYNSEFALLLEADPAGIARDTSPVLSEAISRVRSGRVIRTAGYDGEYGIIRVFSAEERRAFGGQRHLFGPAEPARPTPVRRTRSAAGPKRKAPPAAAPPSGLNPEQAAAVASTARHILVQAGPGTGKTHTLVQRVLRLVRAGKVPCTVITFTNRAADELRDRLAAAGVRFAHIFVGTLHGYCLHWLRREKPGLQVAGPDRRRWLLRSLLPDAGAEELNLLVEQVQAVLHAPEPPALLSEPLTEYFILLARQHCVDIDGVVPAAVALLGEEGEVAAAMRRGTGQLLVDEFQDLSQGQYRLIRLLASSSPVFAIGDPDQAIYGFRGSSPRWFYRFAGDLAAEQHALRRNYRSGTAIVTAAAEVIARNSHPEAPARNEAVGGQPGRLHQFAADSAAGEAAFIVRQVEALIGGSSHREIDRLGAAEGNFTLGDIAVLYRTGRQAEVLAAALTGHGFPVQVVDLVPFYLSARLSPLYLWVLLAAGQGEAEQLLFLLRLEKGVGRVGQILLEQALAGQAGDPLAGLLRTRTSLPEPVRNAVTTLADRLRTLQDSARTLGIPSALRPLAERYGLAGDDPDLDRLLHLAENFGTSLAAFAEHLERYSDSVVYDRRADALALMTLHAAKGLEFPVVFLAGAEEGLLPLAPRRQLAPAEEAEHLEEERRLFYVGMTRAREVLYLSHARTRSLEGRTLSREPSRFIAEIPPALFAPVPGSGHGRRRPRSRQLSLFD